MAVPRMLIQASRTRSPVGRTRSSSGARICRPRHAPATMRTLDRAKVDQPGMQARHAAILVALETKGDIICRVLRQLSATRGEAPADCRDRVSALGELDLQAVLADRARGTDQGHAVAHEHR